MCVCLSLCSALVTAQTHVPILIKLDTWACFGHICRSLQKLMVRHSEVTVIKNNTKLTETISIESLVKPIQNETNEFCAVSPRISVHELSEKQKISQRADIKLGIF